MGLHQPYRQQEAEGEETPRSGDKQGVPVYQFYKKPAGTPENSAKKDSRFPRTAGIKTFIHIHRVFSIAKPPHVSIPPADI
jgi:hypothetical protein